MKAKLNSSSCPPYTSGLCNSKRDAHEKRTKQLKGKDFKSTSTARLDRAMHGQDFKLVWNPVKWHQAHLWDHKGLEHPFGPFHRQHLPQPSTTRACSSPFYTLWILLLPPPNRSLCNRPSFLPNINNPFFFFNQERRIAALTNRKIKKVIYNLLPHSVCIQWWWTNTSQSL